MWIIEKDPGTNQQFSPINLDLIVRIRKSWQHESYGITFERDSETEITWLFDIELNRDKYFDAILTKLPRLNLGIDQISLQDI